MSHYIAPEDMELAMEPGWLQTIRGPPVCPTVAGIRKMSFYYTRNRFMQCIFFTYTCLCFLSFVHKIDLLNLMFLCKLSAVSVCILEEELISTHCVSSLRKKGKNGCMMGFISYEFLISNRTCNFYLMYFDCKNIL